MLASEVSQLDRQVYALAQVSVEGLHDADTVTVSTESVYVADGDFQEPTLLILELPPAHPGWVSALPVLQELRTHLTATMLDDVLAEGALQGLRFLGAFDADVCLGVAGWRIVANTSAVRKLYIDDLVTTERARSRGVGAALIRDLEARAAKAGCRALELDSGVQKHSAHRFYLRERMDINAHHFTKRVHKGAP